MNDREYLAWLNATADKTDRERHDELASTVARCHACLELYGHTHYINMLDIDIHEAAVRADYRLNQSIATN